jgi:hypothetical protein
MILENIKNKQNFSINPIIFGVSIKQKMLFHGLFINLIKKYIIFGDDCGDVFSFHWVYVLYE